MVIPTPRAETLEERPRVVRRLRGVALWVRDLGASLPFYCDYLGLQLQSMLDLPGAEVQRATVAGCASAPRPFLLELLCRDEGTAAEAAAAVATEAEEFPGVGSRGSFPGHFSLVVESVADVVERLRTDGHGSRVVDAEAAVFGVRSTQPSGHRTQQDRVAIVTDLDGYTWHLLELHGSGHSARERLATVQLHAACLARSLEWCRSVLGMRILREFESSLPGSGRHTATALVGFSEELQGTLLELRQAGDPLPAAAGTAGRVGVSHFVIESEQELAATAAALTASCAEVKEVVLGSTEDPRCTTAAVAVTDPDGWRFCFVQRTSAD